MTITGANTRVDLATALQKELSEVIQFKLAERLDSNRVGLLDVLYAYRLFLGRWPEFDSIDSLTAKIGSNDVQSFALGFVTSPEFKTRFPQASEALDMVVMREMADGTHLHFNLADLQSLRISTGLHELPIQEGMLRVLRPGMNCVDAGAHIGMYSLLMGRTVRPPVARWWRGGGGGKVYSFEPFPRTWPLLLRNINANHLQNTVVATNAACHAHPGRGRMFKNPHDPGNLGEVFVRAGASGDATGTAEVDLVRVDDVVPSYVRIGLVKIDIEGSEPAAMEGMQRILHRDRPIIFTEFNPGALESIGDMTAAEYLGFLEEAGYRCREVDNFLLDNATEYEYQEGDKTTNLVCEPK
ncbi:MAG: FkbM family methyltransferase [Chloroflexi bacterium]|nr:FkbM family methyltransferase [Chloroflexota bacterium]